MSSQRKDLTKIEHKKIKFSIENLDWSPKYRTLGYNFAISIVNVLILNHRNFVFDIHRHNEWN